MKQFTLFTLLYVAMGVCFTIIALQQPGMTPILKSKLLGTACVPYLAAVVSTFPLWHQIMLRSQTRLVDKPIWLQICVIFGIWVAPAFFLVQFIISFLVHSWSGETIFKFCQALAILMVSVETHFVRSQARQ